MVRLLRALLKLRASSENTGGLSFRVVPRDHAHGVMNFIEPRGLSAKRFSSIPAPVENKNPSQGGILIFNGAEGRN